MFELNDYCRQAVAMVVIDGLPRHGPSATRRQRKLLTLKADLMQKRQLKLATGRQRPRWPRPPRRTPT